MAQPDRFAIVGDLVHSRTAEERSVVARRIRAALRDINRGFQDEFLAPPVLIKGIDELSAVMRRPDQLFDVLVAINIHVWPLRFRFGVGAGAIDVGLRSKNAASMDGPAFHLAADAIRRANQDGRSLALAIPAADDVEVQLIEALADAHRAIMMDWSLSTARVAAAFRQSDTQVRAAKLLNVSQQFVSKELERGHHRVLKQLEGAAGGWFMRLHGRRSRR